MVFQGQYPGRRQQQPEKTEADKQQRHHQRQAIDPQRGERQQGHDRCHARHRPANQRREAEACTQARGQLAQGKKRRRVEGKAQAELRWREPVVLDVNEWRAADEHEERRKAKTAHYRQPGKHRITQQRAVAAERIAQGLAQAAFGGVGFRQLHGGHDQAQHCGHTQHPKHFAPAPHGNDHAAGQRCENR